MTIITNTQSHRLDLLESREYVINYHGNIDIRCNDDHQNVHRMSYNTFTKLSEPLQYYFHDVSVIFFEETRSV